MTYELYRYIFIGGAILSVLFLITSVILFFLLRIQNVFGDLTGANERKAIENIRNQAADTKNKPYIPGKTGRGLTGKIIRSGSVPVIQNPVKPAAETVETSRLDQSAQQSVETTVLESPNETAETTLLKTPGLAATVAQTPTEPKRNASSEYDAAFQIVLDITYVHASEVIE